MLPVPILSFHLRLGLPNFFPPLIFTEPSSVRIFLSVPYSMLYTGLFEMIVGVLTTCHTQHT